MTPERLRTLFGIYRDGLLKDTLPFWIPRSIDRECGGYLTAPDQDGSLLQTDKPVWVQGRFAWLLATLFTTVERRDEWLDLSRHGIDFLNRYCYDSDGRMFFSVTRDGRPLRKRRYVFSEAFSVMALAAFASAAGDEDTGRQALDLFRLLLEHHRQPGRLEPKVLPATRPMKGLAMPMILIVTAQELRKAVADPICITSSTKASQQVRPRPDDWRACVRRAVAPVVHHDLPRVLRAALRRHAGRRDSDLDRAAERIRGCRGLDGRRPPGHAQSRSAHARVGHLDHVRRGASDHSVLCVVVGLCRRRDLGLLPDAGDHRRVPDVDVGGAIRLRWSLGALSGPGHVNGKARLAASFGGPLLFLFNQFVVFRYFVDAGPASVYLVVFASMAATTVLWVVVGRFTQPEPEEKLVEFYRRARPMGAWGPIAEKAGIESPGWSPVFRGLGIAVCGAVMTGAAIVALSCAYVARWNVALAALLISVITGVAFRRWFRSFITEIEGPLPVVTIQRSIRPH